MDSGSSEEALGPRLLLMIFFSKKSPMRCVIKLNTPILWKTFWEIQSYKSNHNPSPEP